MLKNYYKLKISGKNIRRFIKLLYNLNISLSKIEIFDNYFYVKVDEENYKKILNIKTSYEINIERVYGLIYIKEEIKKNLLFLFSSLLSFFLVIFLSNFIFSIEIAHDDPKIREIIQNEFKKYHIEKFHLVKSYNEIEKIKEEILNSNKNDIEWLEIERSGTKYTVRIEKRIINDLEKEESIRHIVAKKPGIIKKIEASDGEIIKKINDYVNTGDIIISGEIHKGEDIKDNVSADGDIYAEVWYKVKVELPINYYEKKYTGNNKKVINISFLNKGINFLDENYKNSEIERTNLYSDLFGLFSINIDLKKELYVNDSVNLVTNENDCLRIARAKIEERLKENEYIISQKKLKTTLNNSTINVEVFFKVYENIASYKYYTINEGMWLNDWIALW